MRVAVDLEDVIVDTNAVFMEEMNSFLSKEFPESDLEASKDKVSEWGMGNLAEGLAELMGWQDEIPNKFFYGEGKWKGYIPITEEIWREKPKTIPKVENNIEKNLKDLSKSVEGEIHLVTARKRVKDSIKYKLKDFGTYELFDKIVIESNKQELSYDIYIDDNPELRKELQDGQIQLIRERPWNSKTEVRQPHRKVKNLKEATEMIQHVGSKV